MEECNRGLHISGGIRITPESFQIVTQIVNQPQGVAQGIAFSP